MVRQAHHPESVEGSNLWVTRKNITPCFPLVRGTQSIPPLTRGGQEGLMNICLEMLKIMKKQAPIVFWDFEIDEEKKIAFKKDEAG